MPNDATNTDGGAKLPEDDAGPDHAWADGARLYFVCEAEQADDDEKTCGRMQSCVPPGAAGGIAADEARAIGWEITAAHTWCPMCAARLNAPPPQPQRWNGSAWVAPAAAPPATVKK